MSRISNYSNLREGYLDNTTKHIYQIKENWSRGWNGYWHWNIYNCENKWGKGNCDVLGSYAYPKCPLVNNGSTPNSTPKWYDKSDCS